MTPLKSALLSHGELRALLELHGLQARDASPLKPVLQSSDEADRRSFARRGLTGAEWRKTLSVLCDPVFEARSLLAWPEQTSIGVWYADRAGDGSLVECREEGERVRIAFPLEPSALAKADADAIGATDSAVPDAGELRLSLEGLSTLAAAVDAVRTVLLTSILQRTNVPDLTMSVEGLRATLETGIDGGDARWVVTLLRTLAPPTCAPLPSDFDNGYAELLERKLVSTGGDGLWRPSDTVRRLAAYWKVPLPAISHETATLQRDGSQQSRCRVTVRGDGPLWAIDYADVDGERPSATLRSVDGDVWFMEVLGMLTPPVERTARPAPASPRRRAPSSCPSCGQPVKPGRRFCTNCGKPVGGEGPVVARVLGDCASCGAALKPGAKFCTTCGKPVG